MKLLFVVKGEGDIDRVTRYVKKADKFATVAYCDHEPPDPRIDIKDVENEEGERNECSKYNNEPGA